MKKILILGFLLLGTEQLSAQALPPNENSCWDCPDCVGVMMKVMTPNIDSKEKAKAVCHFSESLEPDGLA